MAIIIQRTNPDRTAKGDWRCAACSTVFPAGEDGERSARACAEADHARNNESREAGR